jgi:hypothetical protein
VLYKAVGDPETPLNKVLSVFFFKPKGINASSWLKRQATRPRQAVVHVAVEPQQTLRRKSEPQRPQDFICRQLIDIAQCATAYRRPAQCQFRFAGKVADAVCVN